MNLIINLTTHKNMNETIPLIKSQQIIVKIKANK